MWFVVHGKLDEIDINDIGSPGKNDGSRDAAGMHFESRLLEDAELKKLGLTLSGKSDRFGRIECSLFKEVEVTTTNRSLMTRSERSLVIATGTVHDLPVDEKLGNGWRAIDSRPGKKTVGPWQPYAGGISYTKVSRLDFHPESPLFVEIHGAFAEPKAWFRGRAILKSKINLVANDMVRELRREIAKKREGKHFGFRRRSSPSFRAPSRIRLGDQGAQGNSLVVKLRYKPPRGDESQLIEVGLDDGLPCRRQATTCMQFAAARAGYAMLLLR